MRFLLVIAAKTGDVQDTSPLGSTDTCVNVEMLCFVLFFILFALICYVFSQRLGRNTSAVNSTHWVVGTHRCKLREWEVRSAREDYLFAIQDAIAMVVAGRRATAQAQKWKYGRQELPTQRGWPFFVIPIVPKGAKNAGVYYRKVWLLSWGARAKRAFLPWFSKEKKPLHNGSYEHRVPKIKKQNILLYVCVIQHPLPSTW